MSVDPRLNCAAEICCPPRVVLSADETKTKTQETVERSPESFQAAVGILIDCGVPEDLAPKIAKSMHDRGIVMLSKELATAIREIAFPAT